MDPADAVEIGRRAARSVCPRGPWADDVAGAAIEAAWLHPEHATTAAWRAAVDELRRLTHHRRRGDPVRSNASRWVDEVVSLDYASDPDRRTAADFLGADDSYDLGPDIELRPHQRRVVALLGLGYSKTDAAEILGVTQSAISFTLAQLRRTIRGQHGQEAA